MTINRIKFLAITLLALPVFALAVFNVSPKVSALPINQESAEATYKAKCAMCHSPKAEKHFDTAKTDAELVEIIMKGKKGEKPPYMPGFEAKGMKTEEAQALVTYMRQLKTPAN